MTTHQALAHDGLLLGRPTRVLVVEDEEDVALPLVLTLERAGYLVTWVEGGLDALDYLRRHPAELVVLDLGLPDVDGLEVCRQARADGYAGGLLIITGRAAELDRVVGLDGGADDYLVKPFGFAELQARIRALLRRRPPAAAVLPPPSGLTVDVEARRVRVGGVEVMLGRREFEVLRMLYERYGEVVARADLVSEAWPPSVASSRKALDVTVARLRQKIEKAGARERIVAVHGVGFQLRSG